MPKKPVTDPITDQEIAFARLILSGAMNDRRAADAVGLNPSTAAYTKSKPRVRDYMSQHRAAVSEKLINQEAQGMRDLNIGRDQILARLWHLANLNPEATRGSMAGQIKALSMIIAIEGLIPDRRLSSVPTQPASPPVQAKMYVSEWLRRQREAQSKEPGDAMPAAEAQPAAPQAPEPSPPQPSPRPTEDAPSPTRNQNSLDNPFIYPEGNWVPEANGRIYDADIHPPAPPRLSIPPRKGAFPRGR